MDFLSFLHSVRSRPRIGYLAAVALPLFSDVIRTASIDVFIGAPYVTFFLVVLCVALIGTRGAAVFATILSALLANRFSIDSKGSFLPQTFSDEIGFTLFLMVSAVVILLTHALSTTLMQLSQTEQKLAAANAQLEQRVEERTAELLSTHDLLVRETHAKAKAEAQARQSQKMEAIGLLTGGIAHDFNNMLSIIVVSLELIKRRVATGSTDIGQPLDNAMDGARRSAALTHRLLAFSRKQPLAPSVQDINERIGGMEDLLQRMLGPNIAVHVTKTSDGSTVKVDPSQLENAILNLAINARDAMPSGGTLEIEISGTNHNGAHARPNEQDYQEYVVISVSDTGVGIPKDALSRVFEPFFTTKPAEEGTGLGLAQLYGFAKQSGGYVNIDSTLGTGTIVRLHLPLYREPVLCD